MSSIQTKIQQSSARNSELLAILAETDHAPAALEQQKQYIGDLEKQIWQADQSLKSLGKKREKELKEHADYRDSVLKRFAYKATGQKEKFAAKASKEERDYFEVLEQEQKAKASRESTQKLLYEAREARTGLENETNRHQQAQIELDSLYHSIFQGPNPEFPEEDNKESASQAALQNYHDCRVKAEAESQVIKYLEDGRNYMGTSINHMEEALSHSRMDMFGGGSMTDMMERNAVSNAERNFAEAKMMVLQARNRSPLVKDLPPVEFAKGSIMSDVLFDNIFSDMAFHDKLKTSRMDLGACMNALEKILGDAKGRHQALLRDLNLKTQALNQSRVDLQKAREAAFARAADKPLSNPPKNDSPPKYEP